MKIVGIGDLFIPETYIHRGFEQIKALGITVETVQWQLEDLEALQHVNLLVEQHGAEGYEPPEYILDAVKDADMIITQFCTVTKKMIENCHRLKAIGVLRGGTENVNHDSACAHRIKIFNTPGRNSDAVSDFTVGLLLSECKNIAKSHHGMKKGQWIKDYPNSAFVPDLPGKTVGIIGMGEIGRKVAKRLVGFDVKILTYDPYAKSVPEYVTKVSLEELMEASDFVTIHARLTEDTHHMINAELLNKMKPTAYFINTARAGLVDEKALYDVLFNNKIAGAAIDVFEHEPVSENEPLVTLDNITLTPHLAGTTKDAFLNSPLKLANRLLEQWDDVIKVLQD